MALRRQSIGGDARRLASSVWGILSLLLMTGFVVLVWTASFYLVRQSGFSQLDYRGDGMELLLMAGIFALFVFSILLAVLAFVVWGTIREVMRDIAERAAGPLRNELRGRVLSILGYALGEMSVDPESLEAEPGNRERLEEAVRLCQQGYDFLKVVGGPAEYMGLNNLVFYSFLLRDESRSRSLLKHARRLKETGYERSSVNLLLTSSLVLLRYGESEEKIEARQILTEIKDSPRSTAREKREAEVHLNAFPEG